MKKFFRTIILCLISVVSVSLKAYCCDDFFSYSFSMPGCSGWDNFTWCKYTSAAFKNDALNPTATFNAHCCGWHAGGEGSGSVQLGVNQIAALISIHTSWAQTGCGSSYDAMLVLVNQATASQVSDYTNNPITVNNYGKVNLQDTPLKRACATNAAGNEGYEFYQQICSSTNFPTSSTPCTVNDTRLVCSLPIACAIFQYTNNGSSIWNDCYFVLFPPSPPPFCCSISMPASPSDTANICQENTSPSSNNICVPPSPDGGRGVTPVVNNFFTPSIRVAFDAPSSAFLSVSPWCSSGSNPPGCATGSGSANFTPQAGSVYTIQQCTTTGQQNCITIPQQTSPNKNFPTNMEVIYYLPNNPPTSPLASRYYYQTVGGAAGSLYGVNLGNYCDLSHSLVSGNPALCTITDSNDALRAFQTYLQCDPNGDPSDPMYLYTCSNVCVRDVTFGGDAGSCFPVPAMPLPESVTSCGTNTPTNFCMKLAFQDGYTGQINGTIPSTPPSAGSNLIYYISTISGSKIGLQAMVTDNNYNQPDGNGNICLNSNGAPVSTPCPAYKSGYQPGGLYYVNGQYMGGGTQFCYLPQSTPVACPPGCVSDCNCVESKMISGSGQSSFPSLVISDRIIPPPSTASPLNNSSLSTVSPSSGNGVRGMNSLEAGLCVPIPLPPPAPPPAKLKPAS
jgi:hypothetical protein